MQSGGGEKALAGVSDEELAARLKAGDGSVVRPLLERYRKPLHGFLTRVAGDPHAADDLFQETFIRVLRGIGRYEDGRPFRPWLYKIALNQARNAFRKKKARARVSLDGLGGDEGAEASVADVLSGLDSTPLENAERAEAAALVRDAVERLTGAGREALVLFYFEGLKYEEVAEVLAVPLGTVKSRIHNALARLVVVLGKSRAALGESVSGPPGGVS